MPETPDTQADLLPVEEPEELPGDELVAELLPRLTEDDERELASVIQSDYIAGIQDRDPWEQNLAKWDDAYHGNLPDKVFPWVGCSNLNVPLTATGVETLKPRLVEAVLGAEPPVLAIPTEATDEDRRDRVELFLNWQIRSEMALPPIVEESSHLFLIPGTVVAKVYWKRDVRRVKAIRHFPPSTDLNTIFDTLFGRGTTPEDMEQKEGGLEWSGEIKRPDQQPLRVRMKFLFLPDDIQVLVEKDEVVYEAPQVDLIDSKDFIVPVRAGGNIQKLPWFQHRQWLYEHELRDKVTAGVFYAERVEELITGHGPDAEPSTQDAHEVEAVREQAEGIVPDNADARALQFEIIEDYRRYDIDGDGWDEEIITWISPHLPGKILGWDYKDNIYHHGLRPFVRGAYMNLPFMFYGKCFAELIAGLQEEINTIHNMRVDSGTIRNTPGGFYRASCSTPPGAQKWKPGEWLPMDNPQTDVQPFQWNGNDVWGQNEESLIYQYFERLTGLTDLALGRQPNRVGATRTATGVASLLSEAGLRFKTAMQSFQRFWAEIFQHILALDQQYLPPGKEFRVTGRYPEVIRIADKSEISGKFDIRVSATTETLNREVMRQDSEKKLQAAMNPVLLQLGIIKPQGIYRLTRELFRLYGETDPDMVLSFPREAIVRTPDQELAMWASGESPEPTMLENLPQHIETHMALMSAPEYESARQILGPEGMVKVQKHLAQTLQLMQSQALANQLQQSGGKKGPAMFGEQAQNAQIGAQAPDQPAGFGGGAMAA